MFQEVRVRYHISSNKYLSAYQILLGAILIRGRDLFQKIKEMNNIKCQNLAIQKKNEIYIFTINKPNIMKKI